MLIELNYVFFSLLLVIYGAWRYFKRKEKHLLYPTISFTFLALSAIVKMLSSTTLVYGINVKVLRLLKLGGLALFACFAICAIISLRKIVNETTRPRS
jgi:TRAP-type C4-dicarboxylate transport system permease small subunit